MNKRSEPGVGLRQLVVAALISATVFFLVFGLLQVIAQLLPGAREYFASMGGLSADPRVPHSEFAVRLAMLAAAIFLSLAPATFFGAAAWWVRREDRQRRRRLEESQLARPGDSRQTDAEWTLRQPSLAIATFGCWGLALFLLCWTAVTVAIQLWWQNLLALDIPATPAALTSGTAPLIGMTVACAVFAAQIRAFRYSNDRAEASFRARRAEEPAEWA